MTWRVAKSLDVLLKQINALSPNRSKDSDGSIGDEGHSARTSDHNPNDEGVVCARDFTNDPAHGINSEELAEALRASHDPRIKYIISNRKIASGTGQGQVAWGWRHYTGTNPHDHHCHVSVKDDAAHYDSETPWNFTLKPVSTEVAAKPAEPALPILRQGSNGTEVLQLQTLLNKNGAALLVDRDFGRKTKDAVIKFQSEHHLVADGIVGSYTWKVLKEKV